MFAMADVQLNQGQKPIKTARELLGLSAEDFAQVTHLPLAVVAPFLGVPETAVFKSEKLPEIEISEVGSLLTRLLSREWIKYPALFLTALIFFYVILNFGAISARVSDWISSGPKEDRTRAQAATPADYALWLKKYYFFTNDPDAFLPSNDPDGDGLVNVNEYHLGTNPLDVDTDNDRYDDGREVLNGYNPLYAGKFLGWQQKVIAEKINLTALESRKNLQNVSGVAGEKTAPLSLPASTTPAGGFSPAVSANLSTFLHGDFVLDPSRPGQIRIAKIGVLAPIIWSKSFVAMEDDLKYGVVHHPDTSYPAQWGTASIHGHSSGNPWDGNFKYVFTKLNFLEAGDEILITVYNETGAAKTYRFVVREKKVFGKSDKAQFAPRDGFFLNLSTSWPIGTAKQRYVVTTELVGIE